MLQYFYQPLWREYAFQPIALLKHQAGLLLREESAGIARAMAACERALKILRHFLPEGHPNIKIVEGNLRALEKQ